MKAPAGQFWCAGCKSLRPVQDNSSTGGAGGTGYGVYSRRKFCYACCGKRDAAAMVRDGRAVLYLTSKVGLAPASDVPLPRVWEVTNWPGTLRFAARVCEGRHNIGRTRFDAWFVGPEGKEWHGVNIGGSQICRCKRQGGAS